MSFVLDLLLAMFLAGLLTAAGSLLGMVRAVTRAASHGLTPTGSGPGFDLLQDYLQACAEECRAPLWWYTYRFSLWVGLGALLLAFL